MDRALLVTRVVGFINVALFLLIGIFLGGDACHGRSWNPAARPPLSASRI